MNLKNCFWLFITMLVLGTGCGKKEQPGADFDINSSSSTSNEAEAKPSRSIDLVSKGIGPITELSLADTIDQSLALSGKHIYEQNCTICHKPDEQFIGPAPKGILDRRTPEWVMNMILNPDQMLKEDSLAQALFIEFNGSPMANQHLSENEARAILEYFRTL